MLQPNGACSNSSIYSQLIFYDICVAGSSCDSLILSLTSISKGKQGDDFNAPSIIKILLFLFFAFLYFCGRRDNNLANLQKHVKLWERVIMALLPGRASFPVKESSLLFRLLIYSFTYYPNNLIVYVVFSVFYLFTVLFII